jgi:hypothetical protein
MTLRSLNHSLLRLGCAIGLLAQSTALGNEPRLDILRAEVRPGDSLELRFGPDTLMTGEFDGFLSPRDAIRLRVWDAETDRYDTHDVLLESVNRCVRVRTEANLAYPVGGGMLLGTVGGGLGAAFDHALGDDSSGDATGTIVAFAAVGALVGAVVGALVMPTRKVEKTLWPQ